MVPQSGALTYPSLRDPSNGVTQRVTVWVRAAVGHVPSLGVSYLAFIGGY